MIAENLCTRSFPNTGAIHSETVRPNVLYETQLLSRETCRENCEILRTFRKLTAKTHFHRRRRLLTVRFCVDYGIIICIKGIISCDFNATNTAVRLLYFVFIYFK